MATHQSAIKRHRQSERRNAHNRHYRSMLKSMTKNVLALSDQQGAAEPFKKVSSLLDKMARKRIIHRNKAANQKSRLSKFINKLPASAAQN